MKTNPSTRRQRWLIGLSILGLSLTVTLYRQRPQYKLGVFQTGTGWGYTIVSKGDSLIYQPTIPGVAGNQGFSTADQAQRVGTVVISKLKHGQFPPTLTHTELAQMGIIAM